MSETAAFSQMRSVTDMHGSGLPHTRQASVSARSRAAYDAALRHSDLVRFLRTAIPLGGAASFALFVLWPFLNPLGVVNAVSVGNLRISGTKVTMEQPRMTGHRSDGKPYELTAVTAVQDLRRPHLVELNEMSARFMLSDANNARMTARSGLFDQQKETMQLREEVLVRTDQQQQVFLRSADIDFKAGTVRSTEPVVVTMPDLHISADEMLVVDSGGTITFTGRVRATIEDRGQIDGVDAANTRSVPNDSTIRPAIVAPPPAIVSASGEPAPAPAIRSETADGDPPPRTTVAPLPPSRPERRGARTAL